MEVLTVVTGAIVGAVAGDAVPFDEALRRTFLAANIPIHHGLDTRLAKARERGIHDLHAHARFGGHDLNMPSGQLGRLVKAAVRRARMRKHRELVRRRPASTVFHIRDNQR